MPQALSPRREQLLLLTLMAAKFTNILDFMIMMPLSAQLMAVFDISTGQFGLLISAYSLTAGITALVASAILDRYDAEAECSSVPPRTCFRPRSRGTGRSL